MLDESNTSTIIFEMHLCLTYCTKFIELEYVTFPIKKNDKRTE